MGEVGLTEVADPARAFLGDHALGAPGSIVAPTLEGTRPLLVEVQALVAPGGPAGSPRRTASGVDPNRLALLIAVLGRRAGVGVGSHDVYANLAGGLSVAEPALDLPLAIALASSLRDRPVIQQTVAVGEVGLLGELRSVPGLERRLREAARLGYRRAIVPQPSRGGRRAGGPGLEMIAVPTLREALAAALEPPTVPVGALAWNRRPPRLIVRAIGRPGGTAGPGSVARSGTAGERNARLTSVPGARRPVSVAGSGDHKGSGPPGDPQHPNPWRRLRRDRRPRARHIGDGLFSATPNGGAFLARLGRPWIVVGFAILPYLTIVPAELADPRRPEPLDGRVRLGRGRAAPRAADGPAARPAAVGAAGAPRDVAAARGVDLPRPWDDWV